MQRFQHDPRTLVNNNTVPIGYWLRGAAGNLPYGRTLTRMGSCHQHSRNRAKLKAHSCQSSLIWQVARCTPKPVSKGPRITVHRNAAFLLEPLHRILLHLQVG